MLKLLRRSMAMRFTLAGAAVVAVTPLCLSFMPARQSGRIAVIKNVRIFDGSTVIEFGLPRAGEVSLNLYDVAGRLVVSLAEGTYEAGYHKVTWTGSDAGGIGVSPGVYFYRLVTGYDVLTRKMLVVK